MNRRQMLAGLSAAAAGLTVTGSSSAQNEDGPEDVMVREVDIMAFQDGVIWRENDQQLGVPMIYPIQTISAMKSMRSAEALFEKDMEPPTFPLLPLFDGDTVKGVAFNFHLPEAGDDRLFEASVERGASLVTTPDPDQMLALKNGTKAVSNQSDGTIRRKWETKPLFRFEAHGIIRKAGNLNPTCVPGAEEGIWSKLDLNGWLTNGNTWDTYAEGTLASITGRPGVYQFHWTKPRICSTGNTEHNAVYNGVRQMIRDLVQDVLGSVGKLLDDLLRASHTIASFIADSLIKWIRGSQSTPGNGGGGGTQPSNPPTFALAINPTSASVRRGASASFKVRVTPANGFNGRVSMTASGQTGSSVSFSPSVLTVGGESTFSIRTSRTSKLGNHTIKIAATSGSIRKEASLGLSILS